MCLLRLRPARSCTKDGFTLVEVMTAAAISVALGGILLWVLIFLAHDFSSFMGSSYATARLDVAGGKIVDDLMRTGKKDPFKVSYKPIKKIGGNYIVYQIVTPDENGNIFSLGRTNWGDGKEIGKYIRLGIEGDGNLWRSSGTYAGNGFVKENGEMLVPNADFSITGITTDGDTTNIVDLMSGVSFEISCTGRDGSVYSRRYVVKLRN